MSTLISGTTIKLNDVLDAFTQTLKTLCCNITSYTGPMYLLRDVCVCSYRVGKGYTLLKNSHTRRKGSWNGPSLLLYYRKKPENLDIRIYTLYEIETCIKNLVDNNIDVHNRSSITFSELSFILNLFAKFIKENMLLYVAVDLAAYNYDIYGSNAGITNIFVGNPLNNYIYNNVEHIFSTDYTKDLCINYIATLLPLINSAVTKKYFKYECKVKAPTLPTWGTNVACGFNIRNSKLYYYDSLFTGFYDEVGGNNNSDEACTELGQSSRTLISSFFSAKSGGYFLNGNYFYDKKGLNEVNPNATLTLTI